MATPASGVMSRVALQLSGHLRGLCESAAHFEPLSSLVAECRAVSRCDLFVHTWDELYPQTPSWHTWYPSDLPGGGRLKSRRCLDQIRAKLHPTSVAVERQEPNRALANATWIVIAGRHRETHVSLAGLRSAVRGVAAAAALRRTHELSGRTPPYDIAVRIRPDLYHRRNTRRNTRSSYRGVPVNQICSVPSAAWPTIVDAAQHARAAVATASASALPAAVHGCDDDTLPGNKSGDMCFWSAPPIAVDRLVSAWDALADEFLESNLCWQRWRAQQPQPTPVYVKQRPQRPLPRGSAPVFRGTDATPAPCAHPETQWEGSAAELILTAAARREGLARLPLHGDNVERNEGRSRGGVSSSRSGQRIPRQAQCT